VTEPLLAQQLESPSGTGRVEPRSDHQPGSPRKPGTGYQPTDRILTGSSVRVRGVEARWVLLTGHGDDGPLPWPDGGLVFQPDMCVHWHRHRYLGPGVLEVSSPELQTVGSGGKLVKGRSPLESRAGTVVDSEVTPALPITTCVALAPAAHDENSRASDIGTTEKGVDHFLVVDVELR
jgi:hypothetical protein